MDTTWIGAYVIGLLLMAFTASFGYAKKIIREAGPQADLFKATSDKYSIHILLMAFLWPAVIVLGLVITVIGWAVAAGVNLADKGGAK